MIGSIPHPLYNRFVVLRGKDAGGSEHGSLPPIRHGTKQGTHGHLRFAESNVATYQPVHRSRSPDHVVLDVLEAFPLVGSGLEREALGELVDPSLDARVEWGTVESLPCRVQGKDVLGHLHGRRLDLALGLRPGLAFNTAETRLDSSVARAVAGHAVCPLDWHVHDCVSVCHLQQRRQGVGDWVQVLLSSELLDNGLYLVQLLPGGHELIDDLLPPGLRRLPLLFGELRFGLEHRLVVPPNAIPAVDDKVTRKNLKTPTPGAPDAYPHELLAIHQLTVDESGSILARQLVLYRR
mmetsp:Transcript_11449/g.26860  ORF Transcript_11449/g.26860 Transcript_11449/m.26860 type:complete len:294 (-) Transcript_11449:1428-2309(-)